MAKFSCKIKKLLVLGADPSFLLKKNVYQAKIFASKILNDIYFIAAAVLRQYTKGYSTLPPHLITVGNGILQSNMGQPYFSMGRVTDY